MHLWERPFFLCVCVENLSTRIFFGVICKWKSFFYDYLLQELSHGGKVLCLLSFLKMIFFFFLFPFYGGFIVFPYALYPLVRFLLLNLCVQFCFPFLNAIVYLLGAIAWCDGRFLGFKAWKCKFESVQPLPVNCWRLGPLLVHPFLFLGEAKI